MDGRTGLRVAVGFLKCSEGARCTFLGSADSNKSVDFDLNSLSARPKESQGNSLATVLTATIFAGGRPTIYLRADSIT